MNTLHSLCRVVFVGSDAPQPHLPSLDTAAKVSQNGVILTVAIIITTIIIMILSRLDSVKPLVSSKAEKLEARSCHIVLSIVCEFHLDTVSPSSEVSSESSTPVMSSQPDRLTVL